MNRPASRRGATLGAAACVVLLLCAAASPAQDLDDVTFSGAVTDERGALLPGATVSAVSATTKVERAAATDAEGRYRLAELPPGTYAVRVSREGFAAEVRANVSAGAGRHVRLDFRLRAAGPEVEELVVSASETPPVDTTRVVAGGSIGREELERLPSGSRSALDFALTLGGVAEGPLSTLYS